MSDDADAARALRRTTIAASEMQTVKVEGGNLESKKDDAFAKLRANPAFAGKTDDEIAIYKFCVGL